MFPEEGLVYDYMLDDAGISSRGTDDIEEEDTVQKEVSALCMQLWTCYHSLCKWFLVSYVHCACSLEPSTTICAGGFECQVFTCQLLYLCLIFTLVVFGNQAAAVYLQKSRSGSWCLKCTGVQSTSKGPVVLGRCIVSSKTLASSTLCCLFSYPVILGQPSVNAECVRDIHILLCVLC